MVNESDPAAKDAHGEEMESFGRDRLGSEHRPSIEFACMTFDEDMIYPLDEGRNKASTRSITHPFHTIVHFLPFWHTSDFAERAPHVVLLLLFASTSGVFVIGNARCACTIHHYL